MNNIGKKLLQESIIKNEVLYLTGQHIGGLRYTEKLVKSCHINNDKYVLDVGCGIGTTSCYLAKKYGCRVLGIDLNKKKIEWSNEKADKEHIDNLVKFEVADARNLPFEDDIFDIVITEAVIVFINNKQKAVNECSRVVKPGGYLGLHEGTWLKTPTKEMINLFLKTNQKIYNIGFQGYDYWMNEFTDDGWVNLLKNAGLKEINAVSFKASSITRLGGLKAIGLKHLSRSMFFYIISPKFRKIINLKIPKDILEYYGNGIYVGKKLSKKSF